MSSVSFCFWCFQGPSPLRPTQRPGPTQRPPGDVTARTEPHLGCCGGVNSAVVGGGTEWKHFGGWRRKAKGLHVLRTLKFFERFDGMPKIDLLEAKPGAWERQGLHDMIASAWIASPWLCDPRHCQSCAPGVGNHAQSAKDCKQPTSQSMSLFWTPNHPLILDPPKSSQNRGHASAQCFSVRTTRYVSSPSQAPALALQLYPRGIHCFWRATFGCKLIEKHDPLTGMCVCPGVFM